VLVSKLTVKTLWQRGFLQRKETTKSFHFASFGKLPQPTKSKFRASVLLLLYTIDTGTLLPWSYEYIIITDYNMFIRSDYSIRAREQRNERERENCAAVFGGGAL